jgi:hypothetical protein
LMLGMIGEGEARGGGGQEGEKSNIDEAEGAP